jgi:hypothetical protein
MVKRNERIVFPRNCCYICCSCLYKTHFGRYHRWYVFDFRNNCFVALWLIEPNNLSKWLVCRVRTKTFEAGLHHLPWKHIATSHVPKAWGPSVAPGRVAAQQVGPSSNVSDLYSRGPWFISHLGSNQPDRGFSWVSSVLPGKWWDGVLN